MGENIAMKDYLRRIFSFPYHQFSEDTSNIGQRRLHTNIKRFLALFYALLPLFMIIGIILSFAFMISNWQNVEKGGVEMVTPYAFLIFYFSTFLVILQTIAKPNSSTPDKQGKGTWLNPQILLIISIFTVIFLMSERIFRFTLPTGGDTPIYICEINNLARNGVTLDWLTRMPATRMFVLVLYPFIALNLSGEIIIKLVPPLLGVLYVLATYSFVKDYNVSIAALSSLVAALSCNTLVLSSQLYANFFAITMTITFFKYFLKSIAFNNKKHIVLASILQFIILQMYSPAWVISTTIIFLFLLFSLFDPGQRKYVTVSVALKVYFISILVICLGPFIFYRLWAYDRLFSYYINQTGFSLLNVQSFLPIALQGNSYTGSYDLHPFLMENPLLLFVASIGVVLLLVSAKSDFRKLVIAWILTLSFAMPFFPFRFRFTVYYPIPILAALVLHELMEKTPKLQSTFNTVHLTKIKRYFSPTRLKTLFLVFIFSILLMLSMFRLRQSWLIYSSADHYADELFWIRDNYDPRTTIICVGPHVHNPPIIYDSDVAWVQGITRAYIYVGNLSDLLSGNIQKVADPWVNTPDKINPSDLEHFTILLLWRKDFPEFYVPSDFEKSFMEEVHKNVYFVER